ncbi:SIS domain-containing protein [Clostridium tertium]|uniref:DNA-binding transcriptional regulator HexR n=1 Tax=Clostridium tertium TaxID=1559 RepID=A0A6N3C7D5_9CLOT
MGDLIYRLLLFLNSSKSNDINYSIAITMLRNVRIIPNMSINKLADLCYTSPAAITRFCHKLGYSSFIEFKENIKININSYNKGLMKPRAINYDVDRNDLLNNMSNEIIDEVESFKNSIDLKLVDSIIELIYSTKNVYIFGTQYSQLMAQNLQNHLASLSKLLYHATDVQEQEKLAAEMDESSLAILISPTGRFTIYHERLWKKIEASPATLVVITEQENPKYTKRSNYIIYLPKRESKSEYIKTHTYDLNFLIEYIYLRYGILYKNI